MKGNKTTNTLMLIVVIAIWGAFFYKLFYGNRPDEELSLPMSDAATEISFNKSSDTFRIMNNYSDPFLYHDKSFRQQASQSNNNSKTISTSVKKDPQPIKPAQPVSVVDLKYLGMIKNNASKKKIAMLSINGKNYFAQENETLENIKVLVIYKDSVKILSGKQKQTLMMK